MNEKVVGLIRSGAVVLMFIIGVVLIMNAMGTTATVDSETQEIVNDASTVTSSVTYALWLVYAGFGAIILFSIWAIVQNPKRFIPVGIGLGVFLIICLIGYSMASSEPIADILEHPNSTESALKWSGAGVKITYILTFLAVALILAQSVRNMLKYFAK